LAQSTESDINQTFTLPWAQTQSNTTMKTHLLKSVIAVILLAVASSIQAADQGASFFLKIDGVQGESTIPGHLNEIDVLAYSFGASNSGSTGTGGGGGAGKANFQDLSLTKRVDGTSPVLLLACASGQHFGTVELKGVRGKNTKMEEYLIIKLTNVLVSSVSAGGTDGGDASAENISFNFEKIQFIVRKTNPNGTLGAPVTMTWNVSSNSP
jgi:type VI secretion system secreted protein Hcp